ncbi:NAD-dependent epimerase/dehydratase family protein [Thalassospira sp. TSL5-1]|uniref:NAD-dependent epimerase/dehydratase family protein n=1 Tax=Thalassospira sp. TSL5-1 TaxID=1544451 RepID=UPI00093DB0EC|nr:NAD-dependent epimerase/dehydratase family protein [Thalassospira sp. TSL5-1]
MHNRPRTALVIGGNGGIGHAVTHALATQGWRVRAFARTIPEPATQEPGTISWIAGDAMKSSDILNAARGVDVIVHTVNPPGYRNWGKLVLPMIDNSIAAAIANGARIVLPGTVYNYGSDVFPDIDEESPQHPISRKGAIRVELEQRLERACTRGARALIVRAGDFFGPGAKNNWFAQALVKPGKPVSSILYPGKRHVGHQWAYLPDVATTMIQLLAHEKNLPAFARFHMNGHWDATGTDMVNAIRTACGRQQIPVHSFPWLLIKPLTPFVPFLREIDEMKYLWRQPVRLKNDRLVAFLGAEPHTPLHEAVRQTLASIGCLPANGAGASPRAHSFPGPAQPGR